MRTPPEPPNARARRRRRTWAAVTLLGLSCAAAALGFGSYAGAPVARLMATLFWVLLALALISTLRALSQP